MIETARCQFCRRRIRLYDHPERGVEFMAHRSEAIPFNEDAGEEHDAPPPPWCAGGGMTPIRLIRNAPAQTRSAPRRPDLQLIHDERGTT